MLKGKDLYAKYKFKSSQWLPLILKSLLGKPAARIKLQYEATVNNNNNKRVTSKAPFREAHAHSALPPKARAKSQVLIALLKLSVFVISRMLLGIVAHSLGP